MYPSELAKLGRAVANAPTPFFLYDAEDLTQTLDHILTELDVAPLRRRIFVPLFTNPNLTLHGFLRERAPDLGILVNSLDEAEAVLSYSGYPVDHVRFAGGVVSPSVLERLAHLGVRPYLPSLRSVMTYCGLGRAKEFGVRLRLDSTAGLGLTVDELDEAQRVATRTGNRLSALHAYAGTNNVEDLRFSLIARTLARLSLRMPEVAEINLCGGFGYDYIRRCHTSDISQLAREAVRSVTSERGDVSDLTLAFEPGRIVFARSGYFLTRVLEVRSTGCTSLQVHVDSCFTQFPSPKITGTQHRAVATSADGEPRLGDHALCELIGPSTLTTDRLLPEPVLMAVPEEGDLVWILDAGAYGRAGSYGFLGFPLPAEYLVHGKSVTLIREEVSGELGLIPIMVEGCPNA